MRLGVRGLLFGKTPPPEPKQLLKTDRHRKTIEKHQKSKKQSRQKPILRPRYTRAHAGGPLEGSAAPATAPPPHSTRFLRDQSPSVRPTLRALSISASPSLMVPHQHSTPTARPLSSTQAPEATPPARGRSAHTSAPAPTSRVIFRR